MFKLQASMVELLQTKITDAKSRDAFVNLLFHQSPEPIIWRLGASHSLEIG